MTILITGASGDIGAAIAREFASSENRDSLTMILAGCRNVLALNSLGRELAALNVSVRTAPGNIGNESFVASLFEGLEELDLLINCAGYTHYGLLQDMTAAEWDQVMDANLKGAFLCCRAAIPLMLKKHSGKIINISSIQGRAGASMEAAYAASKAGLNGLTVSLAKELAPSGIAVNALAPGMADTKMNAHLSPEEQEAIRQEIPAGRFTAPEEVALAVKKLYEMPSYVTGQILEMGGGW